MQHLPIERLAELATSEPTANEREHLGTCVMCSSELLAYERVVSLAADERRSIAPPLSQWGKLRATLVAEGLLTTPILAQTRPSSLLVKARGIAASLALLAGGAIFGRLSAGMPVLQAVALNQMYFGSDSGGGRASVANGREFTSTASAYAALQAAQRDYDRAMQFISATDTTSANLSPEAYQQGLAALDRMAEISLAEVQDRPQDPIMNQVLLTTVGAREMTLNKLGTALSLGNRLTRY